MSKRPTDVNQLAHLIVNQATGEVQPNAEGKNPAAQALGRLGGLKGGHARAKALTKAKRISIAKKAAQARWKAVKKAGK